MSDALSDAAQLSLAERLTLYLADQLGTDVTVGPLTRAGAGSSRENWLFEAIFPDGSIMPLVLRRDPPASLVETSRDAEVQVMQALWGGPVPVPRVRWLEQTAEPLGAPFIIMDCVPGRAERQLLRDTSVPIDRRVSIAHQLCDTLADIHAVDVDTTFNDNATEAFARLAPIDHVNHWTAEIDRVRTEPLPLLRLAGWWLRDHVPDVDDVVLVHGDYRAENAMVDDGVVAAVIDWELAHLGSPAEDVAWYLLHRYRKDHLIEGRWSRADFLVRYAERSGRKVSESEVLFWSVLALYKSTAMALAASAAFISGESNQPSGSAEYFIRALTEVLRADQEWP